MGSALRLTNALRRDPAMVEVLELSSVTLDGIRAGFFVEAKLHKMRRCLHAGLVARAIENRRARYQPAPPWLAIAAASGYSYLRAAIGSTRDARRAGRYAASSAAPSIAEAANKMVTGSAGVTPNSIASIRRAAGTSAAKPIANPATTSVTASRTIIPTTEEGVAPKAIRSPISAVRRTTA